MSDTQWGIIELTRQCDLRIAENAKLRAACEHALKILKADGMCFSVGKNCGGLHVWRETVEKIDAALGQDGAK